MKTQNVTEIKIGGAKRKNGHKLDCICHICENIKNKAKRGGYEKEAEIEIEKREGGSIKKNGHRKICNCPICINMKNAKKSKNNTKTIRKKLGCVKNKTCKCSICKNMHKKGGQEPKLDEQIKDEETPATSSDYDELNKIIGGTRKNKFKGKKKTRKFNVVKF